MTFIGIDVGTGSARAGVFDERGTLLAASGREITMWRPRPGWAQQSSADIWESICAAVREAVAASGVRPEEVAGLGFDATCSLVLADAADRPVSIGPEGAAGQDVIVWMDHRALSDAEEINAIGGAPLRHVGEVISPEMQMPKLRWLQREMPHRFARAAHLWDLPDWLVWRACGSRARSLCSLVCKWTYLGHLGLEGEGWDDDFLSTIGLDALTGPEGHARIGTEIATPGTRLGGLTALAAAELGLPEGIGRREPHRRLCRGAWHAGCGCRAEPRNDRRDLDLPHRGDRRARLCAGRLGALFRRASARAMGQRGRAVCGRGTH